MSADNPARVQELERMLAAELESSVLGRRKVAAPDPETADLLDQLAELGYGGGEDDEEPDAGPDDGPDGEDDR